MFENLKRKRTIKMFMKDINCMKMFLMGDFDKFTFTEDCFSYHVMKNMNIRMIENERYFYVFKKDVPEQFMDYLNKIERFLSETKLDAFEIKISIMQNEF